MGSCSCSALVGWPVVGPGVGLLPTLAVEPPCWSGCSAPLAVVAHVAVCWWNLGTKGEQLPLCFKTAKWSCCCFPFNSQHLPPPDFTQPKWRGGASPFQTLQFSLLHNQMATFLWPTNGFWYYSFCGLFFSSSSSDVKYVLLTWTSVHKFLYNHTAHSILFMWHAKDCTSCARLLSSHSLLCSNSVFPRYNFGMTSD